MSEQHFLHYFFRYHNYYNETETNLLILITGISPELKTITRTFQIEIPYTFSRIFKHPHLSVLSCLRLHCRSTEKTCIHAHGQTFLPTNIRYLVGK